MTTVIFVRQLVRKPSKESHTAMRMKSRCKSCEGPKLDEDYSGTQVEWVVCALNVCVCAAGEPLFKHNNTRN